MTSNRFPLTLLPGNIAVCRLAPDSEVPDWSSEGPFSCVMRTPDELSIVCAEAAVPAGIQAERGFRALKLEGPVPFTTIGVVSGMTKPLAEAGISVFILSTYDTDYLLVKATALDRAAKVLGRAGFSVA
ncbi:MAG: ACT domain-containing protein [Candidatus Thermoplasmatota archaeon]|jgi:hypothetical protein